MKTNELWLKEEWPMLFNMTDDEQDTYMFMLTKDEKILLANRLIEHAKYCLDEIIDSAESM